MNSSPVSGNALLATVIILSIGTVAALVGVSLTHPADEASQINTTILGFIVPTVVSLVVLVRMEALGSDARAANTSAQEAVDQTKNNSSLIQSGMSQLLNGGTKEALKEALKELGYTPNGTTDDPGNTAGSTGNKA